MKQQHDWHEHLNPWAEHAAGLWRHGVMARTLMALAIIVAVAGSLITLAACGALPASITTDAMLIGA